MDKHSEIPLFDNKNGIISLFRAVCAEEFYAIMQTRKFSLPPDKSTNVKYFGVNYDETLLFANKIQFVDIVAVIEVGVSHDILVDIADFTQVDMFLFKHGTIIIQSENLNSFNNAIRYLEHRF